MAKQLPKHYSLVKEHPDSYEIHDKRDNNKFHIAKKELALEQHAKLAKLPKFAEGGEVMTPIPKDVPDYSSANDPYSRWDSLLTSLPSAPNINASPQPAPSAADAAMEMSGMGGAPVVSTPVTPAVQSRPNLVASNGPMPADAIPRSDGHISNLAPQMPSMSGQFGKALAMEESGIQGQASEKTKEGNALAQIQYDAQGRLNQIQQDAEAAKWKLDVEHDALSKEVANGKIDPNQFVHNMGTGNKILAAIAMALGGAGAATAHQSNLAFDTIQNSIKQDIEAQKENLGTKKSLLSENLKRYGDLERATQATMMQMNAMTQGQIAAIAAKSGAAQAPFIAQQQIGQLRLANQGLATQYAMKDAALKGMNNPDMDPALLVEHLVPPEHQKQAFKEIEAAQNTNKMGGSILKNFEEAAKENTALKTGAGMLRTPGSVYALHQAMQPTFADLEGTVRQAAMDNTFKNITPMPGDSEHTVETKRQALREYLQSKKSAPVNKGNHIDLSKFKSTTSPMPPAETETMNGIKYQKVPGGWRPI